jgi:hypothetical protein
VAPLPRRKVRTSSLETVPTDAGADDVLIIEAPNTLGDGMSEGMIVGDLEEDPAPKAGSHIPERVEKTD